jgi:hypothetical protein
MTMPISSSLARHSVDRAAFEDLHAGKPPWDIGKPQGRFAPVSDRVTSPVLDAGCGTGELALGSRLQKRGRSVCDKYR